MAFGASFGAKKSSTKSTTNVDKTDTTNQSTTGEKSTSGVTTNTGSQNTTGSSATQSAQTGTQAGQTTGQQQSAQTTTNFSDSTLAGLESTVQSLFGALPAQSGHYDSDFNKDTFIANGMEAASQRTNQDLDAGLNSMYDQFGGRDDSNSMAMLLANRARADAGASLAGTRANLEAQAETIGRENFGANQGALGQQQGFLANLLNQLKGGVTSTTGQVATAEQTANQTAQSGTSNTQTAEQKATQETQVQQLTELLSQLMKGTTHTVGTETTVAKNKEMGGGLSLGL